MPGESMGRRDCCAGSRLGSRSRGGEAQTHPCRCPPPFPPSFLEQSLWKTRGNPEAGRCPPRMELLAPEGPLGPSSSPHVFGEEKTAFSVCVHLKSLLLELFLKT